MKKYILFAALIASAFTASARSLSPEQALSRMKTSAAGAATLAASTDIAPLQLAFTAEMPGETGENALYIFRQPMSGEFFITPADDCAPALLGYGDNFNPADISPDFRWWLGEYARQIEYMRDNGMANTKALPNHAPVEPLMTTKWNQGTPFNLQCPTDSKGKCVTGCVATAMAQVIKYNECPASGYGTGTHSYVWNSSTLSFNYKGTQLPWSLMRDTYTSGATTAQKDAVATLMYAAGVSVNMGYSSGASGAFSYFIAPALRTYFNYDKAMRFLLRDYFTENEWDEIIYAEIAASRPVVYCGVSNDGGHCFVADGYKSDGLYHINWGWGGMSDGYFLLSALDPSSQGIGGSTSGFNYNQDAVVGIRAAVNGSETTLALFAQGGFDYSKNYRCFYFGMNGNNVNGYFNYSSDDVTFNAGLKFVNQADESVSYVAATNTTTINGGTDKGSLSGGWKIDVAVPSDCAPGTYHVYPVARLKGNTVWDPIYVPAGTAQYVTVRVGATGNVTYDGSNPDNSSDPFTITSLEQQGVWNPGETVKLNATVQNNTTSAVDAQIAIKFTNKATNKTTTVGTWKATLAASSKTVYSLSFTNNLAAGVYTGRALDYSTGNFISTGYNFTVGVMPSQVIITPAELGIERDQYFQLKATVLPDNAYDKSLTWSSSDEDVVDVDQNGQIMTLEDGEATITAETANGIKGTAHIIVAYDTAVDAIEADNASDDVQIFNLQGVRIDRPTPGLNLVRQANGTVTKTIAK